MTDPKKPPAPGEPEEVDWDQALSEWESKTFVPEVAKDTSTDKPGALAGSPVVSKPLYRPPTAAQPKGPPPPPKAGAKPPPAPPPAPRAPPPPPPRAAPPPPAEAAEPSEPPPPVEEEEGGATLIASIPRELLRGEEAAPKSSSRGGLGQMFARSEEKREVSVEVSFDESQPRMPVARAEPPSDVFTSAKPVTPSRPEPSEAPPLRRPSQADASEPVAEGAMFDPFAEPSAPRSAQATRPAEDEIDDLLANPPPSSAGTVAHEPVLPSAIAATAASEPDADPARGPALLAPEARRYDPNEETMVGRDADIEKARLAAATKRAGSGPPQAPQGPAVPLRSWPDELPASAGLSEGVRAGFVACADWLEEEARAVPEKVSRARGLLACSEIHATIGDRERAQALASEARDLAPSLALAHRQARGLMPDPPDPGDVLQAIDAEVKMTSAGPARVHSTLLAADALRTAGDHDGAAKRLDQAVRVASGDARAIILRAAWALGKSETTSAALRLPEGSIELNPIAEALQTALRLRGVERKDAPVGEPLPNELLLRARAALDKGDVATAAPLLSRLSSVAELAGGAHWLAASLGATRAVRRADAAGWLRELVERGDPDARRALATRAMELGDTESLTEAVTGPTPLTSAERVAIAALAGIPMAANDAHLDATAATQGMQALAAAATALTTLTAEGRASQLDARARRTAGSPQSRAEVQLGRLLAASAPGGEIEAALASMGDAQGAGATAISCVKLEMAARAGRAGEISDAIEAWGAARGSGEERAAGAVAAALVAERAGDRPRAVEAYKRARAADPTNEAALRAVASLEQIDLVSELNSLADELGEGPRSALIRIEAITRGEGVLPEPTRAQLLERAHRAAPALPLAAFLAERIARRAGDVEEVLRWIRERRTATADPIEAALEGVREALLIPDSDRATAGDRLLEAQRARPNDVALRELYERMAPMDVGAPDDKAAWRERRAADASAEARTLLLLEAAREYEHGGDGASALRCAEAAAANDSSLGRIARERSELEAGQVARLAEELLSVAKTAGDVSTRREAYERLAVLDATARQDPASALLWHRSILEEAPGYEPSLRHVEHHLIGEGRDEELEPIASAIAVALHGGGPGEGTAHAELAARLRLRGAEGSWEATREMVELAAGETEPSLWSLRMLEAHSRARGDDDTFLALTLRLLDRTSRPLESATLLVHAGEAASRLGRLDEARALLARAATEDPGDVVAWGLLADVCQRSGDQRGAAEACEALARSSSVRDHQLLAWYDAGRIWADEAQDEDRAMVAFEAAAAIDVAYEETFDRLSRLYVVRKMQAELATLLERRLEGISDPEERLAMEVRRGRALLDVGDAEGARVAFEAALAQRPDDANALSAFADLCVAQKDWDAAEQALVRLARLLPTADEQRDVYARLGELYSRHLVNLSRAEVALKEVLKRAPDDVATAERLVDVYRRQNDPARALELQQELVGRSQSPEEKRRRLVELAAIHEQTAHDNRKAEQTLEAARREFPQDVVILRALADFYTRHHQAPAVNILLDRAGSDARRALAASRFSTGLFEVLATVFELRGKKDAARVTQAMLAAMEGRPGELRGAGERAFDPRLDDLLAPEVLTPAMRALLAKTGDALDAATHVDIRAQKGVPLPPESPVARIVGTASQAIGLAGVQVFVLPRLGSACIPAGSSPPTLLVGETLAAGGAGAPFLVLRALKLIQAHASALARTPPSDMAVLVGAWLKCFNPGWQPQGVNAASLNAMGGRIQSALPRKLDPDVGVIALEVAGNLGTQAPSLGAHALAWGNRVALLALGDATSSLDAIALAGGMAAGAPRDPKERATWIGRAPEARDLISFGVADAFAEARARLGLDR
jgi:tetratricopeptide (TPR) repeat protein